MERKLNKSELQLWKEITRDDIKYKSYQTDYNIEDLKVENEENEYSKIKKKVKHSFDDKKKKNDIIYQTDKSTKTKLERGKIVPQARLDLHGFKKLDAKDEVNKFISDCINKELKCVLIITGKKKSLSGSLGILRKALPLWLEDKNMTKYVLAHCYALPKDGGDGARYVLLRKKTKVYGD